MNCRNSALCVAAAVALLAAPSVVSAQRATLSSASTVVLPGPVDSNSPVIWDLEDGLLRRFVMTSSGGVPRITTGPTLTSLVPLGDVTITPHPGNGVWMEAVVADEDGTWYGYYHNENPAAVCGRLDRTVARIGAARSKDRGRTWRDLGIVIEAPTVSVACGSPNRYVIGGVGDLSVMLDPDKAYLYFFFSQYHQDRSAQGVAVARMAWANRDHPVRRVWTWTDGAWLPPSVRFAPTTDVNGVSRRAWIEYPAGTPLVATTQAWHDGDGKVNAFWGPSVHWNAAIGRYVMLLNRAKDENYAQEGIYVSYAPSLDDPSLWSTPVRLMSGGTWYPQVIGLDEGTGSDKSAGASARFFLGGRSEWIIRFTP
ncbi:MAG: hypothetical protein JNM38_25035 [Acidobacteria bacterium]|jgi:hypothetical protein|nr:hypothetical protein [Acidobacteriota bacterium]